jgi:cytochrome bd-type quinol oxidase subunit 1
VVLFILNGDGGAGDHVFGILDLGHNSWMQVPSGYVMENDAFVPNDWTKIIFNGAT